MATGTRKLGEFCWINMLTPDPDDARAFFGALLGWTYSEMPGMGHLIKVDGHDIGGLFDLNGPNTPPGTPPLIGVMVKVESADAMAEKTIALGGQARPAFDIGGSGRMSVLHDPTGAQFDVWEPKAMHGTDVDARAHGAPSWFETLSRDSAKARPFYCDLFGWNSETNPMGGSEYTVFNLDGKLVGGMMQITPEMGTFPSHWGVYFSVNDAEATIKLAAELGATIFVPVMPIPGVGRFCGLISPQGVRFYAIEYHRE